MPSTASNNSSTVKTRILIISDTHDAQLFDESDSEHAFRRPLPKADVLIHCGDLTDEGRMQDYYGAIKMLSQIDAEVKLVIAGNHDISLDERFYRFEGKNIHSRRYWDKQMPQQAKELWTSDETRAKGIRYLEEGLHTITLKNGAKFTVYASPYQPRFWGAFPYERDEDRFNPPDQMMPGLKSIILNPVPAFPDVDIMMTHGPPRGFRDMTFDGTSAGCNSLFVAAVRAKPRIYCFGHIHEGWGAERVSFPASLKDRTPKDVRNGIKGTLREKIAVDREKAVKERAAKINVSSDGEWPLEHGLHTLMVNAAIMNVSQEPVHAPWLVDIDLPLDGTAEFGASAPSGG